jgi:tetratricopeptide (TPR) repeat protein
LATDSTFALAGLGLALANSWNNINEHYGIGRDAALRNEATLGARDRAFIAAFFGGDPALGEPKPAPAYLAAWEDVVHKWPDFAEAWYNLGDRYYHFGGLSGLADPLDQSRTAFRRAMALDSQLVAPLHHLIEIYASRGEKAEAAKTGEQYFARNPSVSRDASAIGWELATVLQDEDWLHRTRANFDKMPMSDLARIVWVTQSNGSPPGDADSALTVFARRASATWERLHAYALRYAFELNAGHVDRAMAAAKDAEGLMPDQPIEALWGSYAALFGGADSTGLGARIGRLQRFASDPLSGDADRRIRQVEAKCLVGYRELQLGAIAGARSQLTSAAEAGRAGKELFNREGRMCEAWLGAAVAVAQRAPVASRMVAQLDTMVLRERVPPRMSLTAAAIMSSRLHEQLGERSLALAASRWRERYTGDPFFLSTQLALEHSLQRPH